MNDKWQAIHAFWNSFGIPAYDETSVPDDAVMPYITYNAAVSEFESTVMLNASLWYNSTSWAAISQKADEIAQSINGYRLEPLKDNQYLFLSKGTPFAQRLEDTNDRIRRIFINVMGEFFTRY